MAALVEAAQAAEAEAEAVAVGLTLVAAASSSDESTTAGGGCRAGLPRLAAAFSPALFRYLLDPERATEQLRQRLRRAYDQAKFAITCATNDQRTDTYSLKDPEDYRDSDGKLAKDDDIGEVDVPLAGLRDAPHRLEFTQKVTPPESTKKKGVLSKSKSSLKAGGADGAGTIVFSVAFETTSRRTSVGLGSAVGGHL